MGISRTALVGAVALILTAPASAALKGDFAGLPICSKLNAMPRGYRPTECNRRAPLRGECRFTLTSNGMPIEYLIDDGVVLDKKVPLSAGPSTPYGLRDGDDYDAAAHKVRVGTGLSSRKWTDNEDEAASYIQSDDVTCGRNKSYSIYVWFRNGRAKSVSISTLPAF